MADPTKYTPAYSYSGWQASNPSRPLPADEVDNDFANVSLSVNQTIDALKDVRRSDGKLKNQSVGPDQLSPALTIGFTFTGAWVDGRSYSAGDGVVADDTFYSAKVAHTADVSKAPGNDAYWNELFSLNDIVVTGGMSLPRDPFVGDGVTKDFTLSFTPLSKFNLFVQVGGVVQTTDSYSSNGNTLTFVTAPPSGYGIEVRGFATVSALVVPEDGSVTTDKLADLSVVTEKLADLSVTDGKLSPAVADKLNGAMQKAAYDPQSIGADAFAFENFTGQAVTTQIADGAVTRLNASVWQRSVVVNVLEHGATWDGTADDGPAIQAAMDAVALAGGGFVFCPAGTGRTGQELKVPSGVKLAGAGMNATTIKALASLPGNDNVITNSENDHTEHADYNFDVHVWDMTVDGNYSERSGDYDPDNDAGNGSNIKFASVQHGTICRVRSIDAVLHCFDIAASQYQEPGVPDKQTQPLGPSLHITIEDCVAYTPWYDDAFTTHNSGYIRIVNCKAFMDRTQRGTPNAWQYGFEADEGSYNVAFEDCEAAGFMRGFAAKAHSGTVSAQYCHFLRCKSDDCGMGFWIWDNITVGAALTRGITIRDCIIANPRTDNPDVTDAAYLMEISHAQSVEIFNLTLLNPGLGNIKITGSATKRVNIDGLTIYGSATVDGGWPIVYGLVTIYSGITGAFVRVANVTSLDTQPRPIIYNEDNDSSLIFENIRANGSDNTKGMIRMPSMEIDNLKINGLHGSGWGGDVYDNAQSQFYSNFYRQDMGRMKWMTIASGSPEGVVYAPVGTVLIGRSSGNYWKKGSAGSSNTSWTQVT